MTPLIDVVFLLLTFFVISFKIVMPEGDFGIKMPLTGGETVPTAAQPLPVEPVRVRLVADVAGNLVDIQVGTSHLGPDPQKLREQVIKLVETVASEQERKNLEAIIDYDYHLKFQHTIDALTAISGYLSDNTVIPLIDKVNFVNK